MMLTDFARKVRTQLLYELFGDTFRLDDPTGSLGGKLGQLVEQRVDEETARERIAFIKGIKRALDIVDTAIREEL